MRAFRTGLPARCRRSVNALSIAARLGRTPTWMRTPSRVNVRATPRAHLPSAFRAASAWEGGAMLVRMEAADDGAGEQRDLAEHELPQQAGGAVAERLVAALRRRDEARARAEVLTAPSTSAQTSRMLFAISACP